MILDISLMVVCVDSFNAGNIDSEKKISDVGGLVWLMVGGDGAPVGVCDGLDVGNEGCMCWIVSWHGGSNGG